MSDITNKPVQIYCDGSCNWRNKRGGFGIYFKFDDQTKSIWKGSYYPTTISRMELWAMITALQTLNIKYKTDIYSDSEYVTNCINKNWLLQWEEIHFVGKKNEDLLRLYLKEYRRFPLGNINIIHVKGHTGIIGNEIADNLAKKGYNNVELQLKDTL